MNKFRDLNYQPISTAKERLRRDYTTEVGLQYIARHRFVIVRDRFFDGSDFMTTVYLSTGDKSKSPRGVLYRETALILCCGLDKAMTPALSLSNSRTIWWAFSRQLQG